LATYSESLRALQAAERKHDQLAQELDQAQQKIRELEARLRSSGMSG